jgi:transcriptional regulator with XRE-family HTH domain
MVRLASLIAKPMIRENAEGAQEGRKLTGGEGGPILFSMRRADAGFEAMLRDAGAMIASIRKAEGLSQAELAAAAALHYNTVSNVEQGASDTSLLVFSLILVRLRCPGLAVDEAGFRPLPPLSRAEPEPLPPSMLGQSTIVSVIGSRLRSRRLDLGLSQGELSGEAGIHLNTLWNLEKGLVAPSVSTMYRLYRALGILKVESSSGELRLKS